MKLVTLEYSQTGNKPHLILFLRNGNTRETVKVDDFKPYFYVPYREHPESVTGVTPPDHYKGLMNEDIAKIELEIPDDVKSAREGYSRTWEDDVKFKTRYLIDRVPKIEPCKLRVQYTDIESCIETGQTISIAVYDNYLEKCVTFVWRKDLTSGKMEKEYSFPNGYVFKATIYKFQTERQMYEAYAKFVQATDPDILTGWYFLDFDMKEIINRMQLLGVGSGKLSSLGKCYLKKDNHMGKLKETPVCQGRIPWDMLQAYADIQPTKLADASLEAVSQKELGEGKHQHELSITDMWNQNISELVEYNCKDSVLVYRIDKKCHTLDYYDALRTFTGCGWENLYSNSQMWDIYLLRKVNTKCALPSKRGQNIPRIPGAEVFTPTKGIHEWVCLLDLKSLYPSIIITFNMSPETLVRGQPEPGRKVYRLKNGVSFYAEPKGLLPTVLLELLAKRNEYKKEMGKYKFGSAEYDVYFNLQTAVKVHMNALYGAMLFSGFRLATREVGESITFCGRNIIMWIRQEVQNLGFKVLYGDTDSVFFFAHKKNLKDIVPEFTQVTEHLNNNLPLKVEDLGGSQEASVIKIEPKKVYSKIFMTLKKSSKKGKEEAAKKRYAGRAVWEGGKEIDEPDIMGFEVRRANSSAMSRELQKKCLKVLIGYEPYDKLRGYIVEAEKMLKSEDPEWELVGVPQGIEDLDSYATEGPYVRGCKYANEFFGTNFKAGDKPKLIYVCQAPAGYPQTDVICYRDKPPKGFKIDTKVMFEKSIESKLESVFETAGINVQEVLHGTSSLDKFW